MSPINYLCLLGFLGAFLGSSPALSEAPGERIIATLAPPL